MPLDLQADFTGVIKSLNKIERKQIPFATSQAINDVADSSVKALQAQAQTKLDRPTPFTLKGFRVQRSSKRNLVAYVYVAPIQERYMKYQIEGGVRKPKQVGGVAVPVGIKLNKYGNIPSKRYNRYAKRQGRIIAERKGVHGVWEVSPKRKSQGIRLGAYFADKAVYDKKFPFYKIVEGVVTNKINKQLHKRLKNALATAK